MFSCFDAKHGPRTRPHGPSDLCGVHPKMPHPSFKGFQTNFRCVVHRLHPRSMKSKPPSHLIFHPMCTDDDVSHSIVETCTVMNESESPETVDHETSDGWRSNKVGQHEGDSFVSMFWIFSRLFHMQRVGEITWIFRLMCACRRTNDDVEVQHRLTRP